MDVLEDAVARYSPERMFAYISDRLQNAQLKTDNLKRDINASIERIFAEYEHRLSVLKLDSED